MQSAIEASTAYEKAEYLSDADITAAVKLFLQTKKGATAATIKVVTHQGIVELTGFVSNLLARNRAEEIALAVRGVRGVINELISGTEDVADEQLQRDVTQALVADPATRTYVLACAADDGVITLSGSVQSWAERQLALRVVQGVRGVRAIEATPLTIRNSEIVHSDAAITTQIRELLDWDIRVNPALIDVHTHQQQVRLTGTVGTAAEKARVVATAYQAGATHVDSHDLVVARWALGYELPFNPRPPRTDQQVAQAVRDTLGLDPRLRPSVPLVQVLDGIVTLTGTMSTLRAREAAEQDARHVLGVWEVQNNLKVHADQPYSDLKVRHAVLAALARDPYLGRLDISVNVLSGKAFLYGRVASHFEQEHASDVAAGISGVAEIENLLSITTAASINVLEVALGLGRETPDTGAYTDHVLAERIRQRYYWSANLHHQEVEVRVENGRATLTGTVDTVLARKLAASEAREMGACEVNNHLHVQFAPE